MRTASTERKTAETDIKLSINLDGSGNAEINSGCGFLDHMLTLFAKHGGFDLSVECSGDTNVDYHHTTEDIGIVLGECFSEALADKKGIVRYGNIILPMDEALVLTAVDISGRGVLVYDVPVPAQKVGDFDTELCEEFWQAFAREAHLALHIKLLNGSNSHHILEGVFKSAARSLRQAVSADERFADSVPSTKGVL